VSASESGGPDEAGFTLVELLAVVTILALISFALTEAFIVGLKTTDKNTENLSRSVAVQTLQSYFTADAQSAKLVSATDPTCATTPGVFLHMSWTDQGRDRDVSYSMEPDGPGNAELVRWSCTTGASPDKKLLGHLTFDPGGVPPVEARCDDAPCPDADVSPDRISLKILTPVAIDLVVQRRAT
jgi:prepilin-type N-terminal cleavage/methylation domain-containing protein